MVSHNFKTNKVGPKRRSLSQGVPESKTESTTPESWKQSALEKAERWSKFETEAGSSEAISTAAS